MLLMSFLPILAVIMRGHRTVIEQSENGQSILWPFSHTGPLGSQPLFSELPKWRAEFVIRVDYEWIQLEAMGSRTYRNTKIVQGILDQCRLDLTFNWSINWHNISGLSPIIRYWSPPGVCISPYLTILT